MTQADRQIEIAIIGGGPAGLAAAETLAARGRGVCVFDAMPSFGRKFLLAGKSGLNLTHSEPYERFRTRFGAANAQLAQALDAFPPDAVRQWAEALGSPTLVGSSGRVFPTAMKASPLLRAWLARLREAGVTFHPRHRWLGFDGERLRFATPEGEIHVSAQATLLALGGASWPKLGSDGAWVPHLEALGLGVAPLRPANCGFDVAWSAEIAERFAGAPVKAVTARSAAGRLQGEFVLTRTGIEGSLVYAHASALRDTIERDGSAILELDLAPGRSAEQLALALARQPAKASFATRLRKGAGLDPVKIALLREVSGPEDRGDPARLAGLVKALPLRLDACRPLAEAISSAGGLGLGELDENGMLTRRPGVFAAGEMLDWEAPTGGYLLTACLATGRAAGVGVDCWLNETTSDARKDHRT
ncbi:TIGR03862 family flavoprotein [Aureimonas ureilytica]|uniref:TIGR03862 family flavoprotein n=1 Tax=Aureimonas ureilytica TaxID=401562 RepID=UPI000360638A|nr:TIGR03862 family flavoprotein [Aureimonas ureilytica]